MAELAPAVIWVSGLPKKGKSRISDRLKEFGLPVFSTDEFVKRLSEWCPNKEICKQAENHVPGKIGKFLDTMVHNGKSATIAKLLLDEEHGFSPSHDAPVSVIEGYMPIPIQQAVMGYLECMGFYVWVLTRREQFESVCRVPNWR